MLTTVAKSYGEAEARIHIGADPASWDSVNTSHYFCVARKVRKFLANSPAINHIAAVLSKRGLLSRICRCCCATSPRTPPAVTRRCRQLASASSCSNRVVSVVYQSLLIWPGPSCQTSVTYTTEAVKHPTTDHGFNCIRPNFNPPSRCPSRLQRNT